MGLFTTKSIDSLRADAESNTLRRALGPLNLTTLGIGSIIGTGIFVLTGTAASQNAGPSLIISMIIAGVGCGFAGLCYAEHLVKPWLWRAGLQGMEYSISPPRQSYSWSHPC